MFMDESGRLSPAPSVETLRRVIRATEKKKKKVGGGAGI
jgi:hypothetical protein